MTPPKTALEERTSFRDCQRCGACCYGDEMWIHLLADDDERLEAANLLHLTVLSTHGRGFVARSMRMVDGRCVGHRDDLGDGRCGCSLYEARPSICRDFQAGSSGCIEARKRRGLDGQGGERDSGMVWGPGPKR